MRYAYKRTIQLGRVNGPGAAWYGGLSKRGVRLGLETERELLRRLGDPQDSLRFVHVAGTDGKGSVCAMIESVLRKSGIRVGAFTSPEILRVNECIRLDGEDVTDAELEKALLEVMEAAGGLPCTSFEALTAAAILHFAESGAEFAVMEVGMGGRLDSTNVIVPEVCVINNIGLEHTAYLGGTVGEIALEKAGIMKPGVPCVTINPDEAFEVLARHSAEVGCELRRILPGDVAVVGDREGSVTMEYRGSRYEVGLAGAHQARNAALAVEGLSYLRDFRDRIEAHVADGLRDVVWHCRLERVRGTPFVLDVTHTVTGARCLRQSVSEIYGGAVVVLGMLDDKDVDGVSAELAGIASAMVATEPDSPRARPAAEIAEAASRHCRVDAVEPDLGSAMERALSMNGGGVVLVTGSLRMAEGALRWLGRSSRSWTSCPPSTRGEPTRAGARRG